MPQYGRDRHRRLNKDEIAILFARAGGRCQRCGRELDATWHQAHLTAWSHGGATTPDKMEAWCAPCNLAVGAQDTGASTALTLREWQASALPVVLERLYQQGVATVHAAPGAGKTIFAGSVFRRLFEAGLAERMIVVVPNVALVDQWRRAMAELQIHLDTEPRDGFLEHPETVGAVVTYQSLPNAAPGHVTRQGKHPTLVVLDEVHHVAEQRAWGRAVNTMVGKLGEIKSAGVLNLTGTLFRSKNTDRIGTVAYEHIETDDESQWRAVADYSIATAELIGTQLRPPDLYVYTGRAEVLDLRSEEVTTGDIADLSHPLRSAVIREAFESRGWVEGFTREALRLLQRQQATIGTDEPLKLLYVASSQKGARRAADAINQQVNDDFARLVVSDEPGALRTLRQATKERRSCAIVSVRMVTEGFDCPEVSTIAYGSNWVAPLFVAQMMARAMRITHTERAMKMILPAQFLIPDHAALRRAFAEALLPIMHVIDELEKLTEPVDVGGFGEPRLPRFRLLDLSSPEFRNATVVGEADGDIPADELAEWERELEPLGVPLPFVPRVALASRRVRRFPKLYSTPEVDERSEVEVTRADPRTINKELRAQLTRISRWMHIHLEHDGRWATTAIFQYQANQAAGIESSKRDLASHDELATAIAWMTARTYEHCERFDETVPSWLAAQ